MDGSLAVVPYTASDIETFEVSEMAPGGAFEGAQTTIESLKNSIRRRLLKFRGGRNESVGQLGHDAKGSSTTIVHYSSEKFSDMFPSNSLTSSCHISRVDLDLDALQLDKNEKILNYYHRELEFRNRLFPFDGRAPQTL